jgi:GNAT superfamily N-acetyltransferase
MHVRTLLPRDLPELLALYVHLHEGLEQTATPEEASLAWNEATSNPRCRYFGGYDNESLIASCTIMVVPNLTRGCRPYGVIENVVTHRDHRSRGWGKAVLRAAIDFAWFSGCYKVMLMTGRKDEAVFKFYEGAGFNRHGKQAFIVRSED